MKRIFKYSPFILLVVYLTKSFIVNPTYFDFGVIVLMSGLFLHTMKIDKDERSDKQELIDIISQMEEKVNDKILELQKVQDNDRLAAENKFSTLNLGIQRQTSRPKEKQTFGWSGQ